MYEVLLSYLLFFELLCTICSYFLFFFFFSSRRRHTRLVSDWSSECALPIWREGESGPPRIDPGRTGGPRDPGPRPPGEGRGPQDPRDLPVPRSPGAPRHRAGTREVHRVREGPRRGVRPGGGPETVGVLAGLFPDPRRRPHGLVV